MQSLASLVEAVMLLSVLALDPPSAALLANSKVDGDGNAHDLFCKN